MRTTIELNNEDWQDLTEIGSQMVEHIDDGVWVDRLGSILKQISSQLRESQFCDVSKRLDIPPLCLGAIIIRGMEKRNGKYVFTHEPLTQSKRGEDYVIKARYSHKLKCWRAYPSGAGMACFCVEPVEDFWTSFIVTEIHPSGRYAYVRPVFGDFEEVKRIHEEK